MVLATSWVVGQLDGSTSGIAARLAGVSMIEGTIAFTQIPSAATSSATRAAPLSVKWQSS